VIHTAALKFFVEGMPVTKGSARAFLNRKSGVPIIVQDNRATQRAWSSLISSLASTYKEETKFPKTTGAVKVNLEFYLPRPESHFKKDRTLKPFAPKFPIPKGKWDADKLARCVLDALTGILWVDDSQVVLLEVHKFYEDHYLTRPDKTGVFIEVEEVI